MRSNKAFDVAVSIAEQISTLHENNEGLRQILNDLNSIIDQSGKVIFDPDIGNSIFLEVDNFGPLVRTFCESMSQKISENNLTINNLIDMIKEKV